MGFNSAFKGLKFMNIKMPQNLLIKYLGFYLPIIQKGTTSIKQNRLCTYKKALRRICATICAVEKQVLNILSVHSFRYPACNEHVPYCHLQPA